MKARRVLYGSTLAAGIGLAGVLGVGLGSAAAEPGQPCNAPGAPACGGHHEDRGPAPANWQGRGIDQGRNDHQPFNWNGQQVTPMQAGNGAGWGFWFLGTWIPL